MIRWAAVAVICGIGCGGHTPRAAWNTLDLPALALPSVSRLAQGEVAHYRVTVSGVALARFEWSLQRREPWVVVSGVITPDGLGTLFERVRGEFTSFLSQGAGALRSERFTAREPSDSDPARETTVDVEFGLADATLTTRVPGDAVDPLVERQALPAASRLDMGGFVLAMRWLDLGAGAQVTADVVRGGRAWRTQITEAGTERVATPLGTFPAHRYDGRSRRLTRAGTIDPSSPERVYSLWISDDADRVLIKVEATSDLGAVVLELVQYGQAPG